MIESYSFGSIQIDGKSYTSDLMVGPKWVESNWWRKSGHSLCEEDLEAIFLRDIDILVVGTGSSGMMTIPEKTVSLMKSRGIALEADKTGMAVRKFNQYLREGRKVAGAFHLTC